MGDENTRTRRGAKDADGRTLVVRWIEYEEGHAWLWAPLGGGSVSGANVVVVNDLVRYRPAVEAAAGSPRAPRRKEAVRIATVQGFRTGFAGGRWCEPLVDLRDLGTDERFTLDIEEIRPLFCNWEGDSEQRLALSRALATLVDNYALGIDDSADDEEEHEDEDEADDLVEIDEEARAAAREAREAANEAAFRARLKATLPPGPSGT